MDANRQLIWNDLLKRAKAAGFVRFDHAGVAVLVLEDAAATSQADTHPGRSTAGHPPGDVREGDALPGFQGGQGGQGHG
jgi:hypothetical protein